jgi:hypothetical protein
MKLMKANQEKAEISFIFGNRILIDIKIVYVLLFINFTKKYLTSSI